jgi:hypothetical protein
MLTFPDRATQQAGQVALKRQHINFRVAGLSLFVVDSLEWLAREHLRKAGINLINCKPKEFVV